MLRLATNMDLIKLKMGGPGDLVDPSRHKEWTWGLNSMGYMFAIDMMNRYVKNQGRGARILEVGAGLSDIFYNHLPKDADYTVVDKAGFYEKERYDLHRAKRPHARFIDTLMGNSRSLLSNCSMDMVFSVSVLEHVPISGIPAVVKDMHRVLKQGGLFVHTLDVHRGHSRIWNEYKRSIEMAGFRWVEETQDINFNQDGLLYEPLSIVFRAYEKRPQMEYKIERVAKNYGCILIGAIA